MEGVLKSQIENLEVTLRVSKECMTQKDNIVKSKDDEISELRKQIIESMAST